MNKHYQITTQEAFLDLMMSHSLDFPLNIVEMKAVDFETFYKKISQVAGKNDWKNASKANYFYKLENRFFRNKKVIDLLQEKKLKEARMNEIIHILNEYRLEASLTNNYNKLDTRLQTIFNFILLGENNSKILINAGWYHAHLMFLLFYFVNDFLKNGSQCILVRNRHFDKISDCYDEYDKEWIVEAESKLKVWYLNK